MPLILSGRIFVRAHLDTVLDFCWVQPDVCFGKTLWTGSIGSYVKMDCPAIANGKVCVRTANGLTVFGLTNCLYLQSAVPNPLLSWAPGGTLLGSTNLTGPWTSVSNRPSYTVVPTNNQMFYRLSLP